MKDNVLDEIKKIALKYNIEKIILFGSRARNDYSPTSDYDIAVFADNISYEEKGQVYSEIEEINTLKKIDVVFADTPQNQNFIKNIKEEGVVIYEQGRKQDWEL